MREEVKAGRDPKWYAWVMAMVWCVIGSIVIPLVYKAMRGKKGKKKRNDDDDEEDMEWWQELWQMLKTKYREGTLFEQNRIPYT